MNSKDLKDPKDLNDPKVKKKERRINNARKVNQAIRQLPQAAVLPEDRSHLRDDLLLLSEVLAEGRSHHRPDGTGGTFWQAEYHRGLCSFGYQRQDRNQVGECGEGESARVARRLYRLSAHSQASAMGEGSAEWTAMRELGKKHNDAAFFMQLCETRPPETIANMAIILINQADYLLFKQLERLEKDSVTQGGFSERMMRVRKEKRGF